jgi:mitochondrial inner membrane protease subunit 1
MLIISKVEGPSMLPTMSTTGEMILENRVVGRFFPERLKRGDLVSFVSPFDPDRIVCKRILGLPGDTICVDPTGEMAPSSEHVIIPKGHLWFSGDNAAWSRDSRHYGPVSIALVRGRFVARVLSYSCLPFRAH